MAVGALADQLEKPFINYMEAFLPILIQGLSNNAEYQVCKCDAGNINVIEVTPRPRLFLLLLRLRRCCC